MINLSIMMKDFIPLIGSSITVFGAFLIAYYATWTMKQTEFFLKFTERFHEVMKSKHELDLSLDKVDEQDERTEKKQATELYRQLFSLMSDEFTAYKRGHLAREAFSEWMRWRNLEYQRNQNGEADFVIGGVAYRDGWRSHRNSPVVRNEFVEFLDEIHNIGGPLDHLDQRINAVVLKWSGRRQKILDVISRPFFWFFVLVVLAVLIKLWMVFGWPISGVEPQLT
jgi:hypothetical protein